MDVADACVGRHGSWLNLFVAFAFLRGRFVFLVGTVGPVSTPHLTENNVHPHTGGWFCAGPGAGFGAGGLFSTEFSFFFFSYDYSFVSARATRWKVKAARRGRIRFCLFSRCRRFDGWILGVFFSHNRPCPQEARAAALALLRAALDDACLAEPTFWARWGSPRT